MKQLMVLVATIVLGITISATVLGFGDDVDKLSGNVDTGITFIGDKIDAGFEAAGVDVTE